MYLRNLSIVNFKNYAQAELSFSEKINCFVGENGVGKTNILDAIHYLALTKSYFNSIDSQNIRYEQDFSVLQGEFVIQDAVENIYCGLQRSKKKLFKKNKKDYPKLADHIGFIPIVMISPSDISLILDGGEERRKFINGVISQFDRSYLDEVISYNRILLQRNKYLKASGGNKFSPDEDMLDIYDTQLAELGEIIFTKRSAFIKELIPVFNRIYAFVSSSREEVGLEYTSQLSRSKLYELLSQNRRKDLILGYTTSGIHRDDLEMTLNNHSLKKAGSQGQQKTYQLALKLGKFEFIKTASSKTPILLLDDVFDKFDHHRVEQIIHLVSENDFGQIFITDTDENRIKSLLNRISASGTIFKIDQQQDIKPLL